MSTRVRVELILSVDADSSWGEDCTIGQAYKQGIDSAISRVTRLLGESTSIKILKVHATEITIRSP